MMRGDIPDLFPEYLLVATQEIDNSPASIAQRERLLRALQQGPVSTFDAREGLGILMPAARIFDLRALGHEIAADYRSAEDSSGALHAGIAHYSLISSSENKTPPQSVASLTGLGGESE